MTVEDVARRFDAKAVGAGHNAELVAAGIHPPEGVAVVKIPAALAVNIAGIPESLRAERRWVVWKREWVPPTNGKPGRWTKVPYVATDTATKADSTDPSTWRSFADAQDAYEDGKCDGIGFVLGDGWTGFDSDHRDSPEHVRLLNTYTERSPSDDGGIHAICRGTKPGPRCRIDNLELYDHGRYLTVTGQHVAGTPTTVEERTAELAVLYARLFPNGGADSHSTTPSAVRDGYTLAAEMDDGMLWAAMIGGDTERSDKILALHRGDTSAYGSHSEADLALCCHLAFWTNYDADRIDRMFRQSGLMRDKWDREDYRRATLTKAMAGQTSDATKGDPPLDETGLLREAVRSVTPAPTAYTFAPAFPPGHFVTMWTDHFSKQCDAPLEYHEGAALVALAAATPSLTARISGSADGLRTNLYVLFVGRAGITRKSTAKDYAVETLRRALPKVLLPEQMTQESFVESLTKCNNGAALWPIDEFTDTLIKMLNAPFLAGMRGVLLEMHARTSYAYRRVSKTVKTKKKGDEDPVVERVEDFFYIDNVTFSLIGCATDTLFRSLDNTVVGSGLLTRFAIIMPESKPARLPQYELTDEAIPPAFVTKLHEISLRTAKQTVTFAPGVLKRIDEAIDKPLDESADRCQMTVRMGVMARKVAMLSAAGRKPAFGDDLQATSLVVTLDDADAAIKVVTRWIGYAEAFEARTDELAFEVTVQKCVAIIKGRTLNRRVIAQRVHVPAKELLEIERTLVQRDQIEVIVQQPKTGRPSTSWRWTA